MPAQCFEGTNVKLSYAFDAMTVYPKSAAQQAMCASAVAACSNLPFVSNNGLSDPDYMSEKCVSNLQFDSELGPIRYVHREDDDHSLYHQDTFHMDDGHMHVKFRSKLTENELEHLLQVFVNYQLITPFEKYFFLLGHVFRHGCARVAINKILGLNLGEVESLTPSVEESTRNIISYLKTIQDNDILIDLHLYLLSSTFDYLRENAAGEISIWQGTDAYGNVVKTSKSWAIIEKSIT